MHWFEVNFDGIIGPTHNYSGLSYGNMASMQNRNLSSRPKEAALEGLAKMKLLMDLGCPQGILPPQERPSLSHLRILGFTGSDAEVIQKANREAPFLLAGCSSASSMWAANAATITPSQDSQDGRFHLTVANLANRFHRSIEAETTYRFFQLIFPDEALFNIHPPLPSGGHFGDEGAANHTRFSGSSPSGPGIHLFVYGFSAFVSGNNSAQLFPMRQSLECSQAIVRRHRIAPQQVIFARQNPETIDLGVFHNDVIAVGNEHFFFYHEKAYVDTPQVIARLKEKIPNLVTLEVKEEDFTISEAIQTYLFNSQIVTLSDQSMALIAPSECKNSLRAQVILNRVLEGPIEKIYYSDIHQSMQNGGGPACLRLRVVLSEREMQAMNPHFLLTNALYETLVQWVKRHYRDELLPGDLADPRLLEESRHALDELTRILQLGNFYTFQKNAAVRL